MTDPILLLVCEAKGHIPVDIDPTGGAPYMGGPVAITICDRCGRELEHSETAKEFNRQMDEIRKQEVKKQMWDELIAKLEELVRLTSWGWFGENVAKRRHAERALELATALRDEQ